MASVHRIDCECERCVRFRAKQSEFAALVRDAQAWRALQNDPIDRCGKCGGLHGQHYADCAVNRSGDA